jgi:hypothetical protein
MLSSNGPPAEAARWPAGLGRAAAEGATSASAAAARSGLLARPDSPGGRVVSARCGWRMGARTGPDLVWAIRRRHRSASRVPYGHAGDGNSPALPGAATASTSGEGRSRRSISRGRVGGGTGPPSTASEHEGRLLEAQAGRRASMSRIRAALDPAGPSNLGRVIPPPRGRPRRERRRRGPGPASTAAVGAPAGRRAPGRRGREERR